MLRRMVRMSKPPKLTKRNIFKDVDYLSKLSEEEQHWLFEFEAKERFGLNATKEERVRINANNYKQKNDVMNVTDEVIYKHLEKKNKTRKKMKVVKNDTED